jgi:hypothetical protein
MKKVPVKLLDVIAWDARVNDTPEKMREFLYGVREEMSGALHHLNDLLMELSRQKKPLPVGLSPDYYFKIVVPTRSLEDDLFANMGGEYRWIRGWAIDLNSAFLALHEALNVAA